MAILDEDVARVRETTDLVSIISQFTQLKRVGRRFVGLCPFHGENTPSFSVNSELGFYYCFGCGVSGDAITFLRDKEQLDFVDAVERLAQKCGVSLRYTEAGQGEDRKRRKRLMAAVAEAVTFYHRRLLTGADSGPARSYLRSRGYDKETVERYQIGWAPDDWDQLATSLRLPPQDLSDSGLGFINRRQRAQDFFRKRIMFPVFDPQGNAVGFGGRKLLDADGPKYKNSSESDIYNKSRILYGLNWAKDDIVRADKVVVCEGYTDVIGCGWAGVNISVATCGTSLTENHVVLLRRFARKVVLAFDADSAGQNASARFYEWEKTHDLDVHVAHLPDGADPGGLAESNPEQLKKAVAEAQPFLEFLLTRTFDSSDLATVEGRAKAADAALQLVAEHPEPFVRDQYVLVIAAKCRLQESLVRDKLNAVGQRPAAASTVVNTPKRIDDQRPSPELEALKLAIQAPESLRSYVVPELFADDLCSVVYHQLQSGTSLHETVDEAGSNAAELIQRLSVEETEAAPVDVASRLWDQYVVKLVDQCRVEARRVGLAGYAELNQQMNWYKFRLEELRDINRRAAAVEELVNWIQQEG